MNDKNTRNQLILGFIVVIYFEIFLFGFLFEFNVLSDFWRFRKPLIPIDSNTAILVGWGLTLFSVYYIVRAVLAAAGIGKVIERLTLRVTIPGYAIYTIIALGSGIWVLFCTGQVQWFSALAGLSFLGTVLAAVLGIHSASRQNKT